jgi:arylamine N-acetyltransferase
MILARGILLVLLESGMARDDSFERYLNILGVADARTDVGSLRRIVRAQLIRVPFENVSKLHLARARGLKGVPELDLYLDGIEQHQFGGTCYSNNYHLVSLLRYVGFDASYCGADMASGMDVHAVVIVRIAGCEYLVDTGYGAPFYEPMPRDIDEPLVTRLGENRYVLQPLDDLGRSRMEHHRDGRRVHGYLAKPKPRDLSFFEEVVRDSFRPTSSFMTQLRVVRFFDDGNVELRRDQIVRARGDRYSVESIPNRAALIDAVVEQFDITRGIVREVVGELDWPPRRPD